MRAKLVQIGNSRGVRLPKSVIEEANLGDEVELIVRKDEIVLRRVKKVREGWAEAFKEIAKTEKPDEWEFADDDLLPDEDWSDLFKKFEE